ncbi:hypothetical protein ADUPG1_002975, partial [Aduncisulcus paluster]
MSGLSPIESQLSPSFEDPVLPRPKKKSATPGYVSTLDYNIKAVYQATSKDIRDFREEALGMLSKLVPKRILSTSDLTAADMEGLYSVTDALAKEEHRLGNVIALKLLTATCKKEYDGKGIGTGKRRTTLTAQRKKQICLSVIRKSPIFGRIYEGTCDADLIEFYKTRIAPIVTTAKGNYRNKKHAHTLQKSLTKYDDDLESSEMEILREYATCKDWAASVASQSLSQSS